MDFKTKAEYPTNCDEVTKVFVDKVNEVIEKMNGIIIQDYHLGRNDVYHTIFKIACPKHVLTIECFKDYGKGYYNTEEHFEKIKIVKLNESLNPTTCYTTMFNGVEDLEEIMDKL